MYGRMTARRWLRLSRNGKEVQRQLQQQSMDTERLHRQLQEVSAAERDRSFVQARLGARRTSSALDVREEGEAAAYTPDRLCVDIDCCETGNVAQSCLVFVDWLQGEQ